MEKVEGEARRISKQKNLTVDEYLDFFDSGRTDNLTVTQLNKIMAMHGFAKLKTKKAVVDGVGTMELMDLCRSTLLDDDVSGVGATVTLTEVIKDLKDLNWEECHITSLLTVGAVVIPTSVTVTHVDVVPPNGKDLRVDKTKLLPKIGLESSITSSGTPVEAESTTGNTKGKSVAVEVGVDSSVTTANGITNDVGSTKLKRKRLTVPKIKSLTEMGVDSSITARGTTVDGESTTRKGKGKGKSVAAEVGVDSSGTTANGITNDAGSTKLKRKKLTVPKIKNVAEMGIDSSLTARGTTVDGESTTPKVKGKGMGVTKNKLAPEVGVKCFATGGISATNVAVSFEPKRMHIGFL